MLVYYRCKIVALIAIQYTSASQVPKTPQLNRGSFMRTRQQRFRYVGILSVVKAYFQFARILFLCRSGQRNTLAERR